MIKGETKTETDAGWQDRHTETLATSGQARGPRQTDGRLSQHTGHPSASGLFKILKWPTVQVPDTRHGPAQPASQQTSQLASHK